ncbi:MAG: hypothetical protein M1819_003096 [Sarea resinae]|nr:MAG: hypothetical protein M1819_003096 [Sarea resinae]
MLRLRRYKVLVVFSVFAIIVLYHFTSVRDWERATSISVDALRNFGEKQPTTLPKQLEPVAKETKPFVVEVPQAETTRAPIPPPSIAPISKPLQKLPGVSSSVVSSVISSSTLSAAPVTTTSTNSWGNWMLPPSTTSSVAQAVQSEPGSDDYEGYEGGEGRLEAPAPNTRFPPIHWTKLPEHFPVPSESIIQLPSAKPRAIPQIQHSFSDETSDSKADRESKLRTIKESFIHAWTGYKDKAWLHDELSPISGKFRDPFCGWAATLVDTLDTLWIMGLKSDFEEAVKAVEKIDFTTTPRNDIPLFETTIRYLGGLLAAYDISKSKYPILLDKAVELAEVLMGAFDTPNRMPITFYHWKPTFASQPHRSSSRVVLSEIGSLSLEFTRLAQITKEPRYYDAIARITDAFELWQNSTKLPGMWPIYVDASGCRKPEQSITTPLEHSLLNGPQDLLPPELSHNKAVKLDTVKGIAAPVAIEANGKAQTRADQKEEGPDAKEQDAEDSTSDPSNTFVQRRQLVDASLSDGSQDLAKSSPSNSSSAKGGLDSESTVCPPQGLASPPKAVRESFTLGALADSLYEYLPKQYMLLGGLNEQYKTMYEQSMNVAKEKLLFRPMTKDDRNVLLFGSVSTTGQFDKEDDVRLTPEGTHLTCFAGGMLALGSKIFGRTQDLAIASRLTDGCVWAYESTTTGIMPESFLAVPCQDKDNCPWNETQWWEALDPWRKERMEQNFPALPSQIVGEDETTASKDNPKADDAAPGASSDSPAKSRRQVGNIENTMPLSTGESNATSASTEQADVLLIPPQSHESYVKSRIESERLPPGFTRISNPKYILRPEAIESVFIMWRVTGDDYWRQKGWKMFTAIQKYTETEFGNTAIRDVTSNAPIAADEMESFWLAETLKYFYLLFSKPDLVSLDDYVLNTEAHGFARPK